MLRKNLSGGPMRQLVQDLSYKVTELMQRQSCLPKVNIIFLKNGWSEALKEMIKTCHIFVHEATQQSAGNGEVIYH